MLCKNAYAATPWGCGIRVFDAMAGVNRRLAVSRLVLAVALVAHGELLAAFCAACGKHLAAVFRGHSLAEAVLVYSAAVVGLVSPFHCYAVFVVCLFSIAVLPHRSAKVCIISRLQAAAVVIFQPSFQTYSPMCIPAGLAQHRITICLGRIAHECVTLQ